MTIEISPGKAKGTVKAPPSKSMAHRLLIAAGLSQGKSIIHGLSPSEDILATMDCLGALGAQVQFEQDTATVIGTTPALSKGDKILPCRESGSTLRFFIPLCLLSDVPHTLTGYGRLMQRPQEIYARLCQEKGMRFQQKENQIVVQGVLRGGDYALPGNVSSQFITGLLYALPLTTQDSTITLLPPIESRSYINLTLSALKTFGIEAGWQDDTTLYIKSGQYRATEAAVEGDYSNSAFLEAFNYLQGCITIDGLNPNSLQGDRVYRQGFQALQQGTPTLSLRDCPDLGPIYMAMAAALQGATFTDTARLKIKESDRGVVMAQELSKFGIHTDVYENSITVHPGKLQKPSQPLHGHNDHRIVMALATLCTLTGGIITDAQAIAKSFPDYFQVIHSLGIPVKEV